MQEMSVSNRGLLEIAEHEGIVPAPYLDSVGIPTFGIGHTKAAGAPNPSAMARGMPENFDSAILNAVNVFKNDLKKYEKRVNKALTVQVKQHEFDALVSFDFNTGGIHRARLTEQVNAGNPNAAAAFFGWLRPPEIRKRRTAESNLFATGDYDANGDTIPIWKVDKNMKLRGRHSAMSGARLLPLMGKSGSVPVKAGPSLWAKLFKIIFGGIQ